MYVQFTMILLLGIFFLKLFIDLNQEMLTSL